MSRLPGKRARPVLGLPDEIYFSVIQRKLLNPNDFGRLPEDNKFGRRIIQLALRFTF